MNATIRLNTCTETLNIRVLPYHGSIILGDLEIEGLTDRAMQQLRNALISVCGFPEGRDLDEIDMDDDGLAEACDKITAHITAGGGVR